VASDKRVSAPAVRNTAIFSKQEVGEKDSVKAGLKVLNEVAP